MTEYAYRFEDIRVSLGVDEFGEGYPGSRIQIQCQQYPILRFTPKGMWINIYSGEKYVSLVANKKFANPCKKQAWEDFKYRKRRQMRILKARAAHAQEAYDAARLPLKQAVETFKMNSGMFSAE